MRLILSYSDSNAGFPQFMFLRFVDQLNNLLKLFPRNEFIMEFHRQGARENIIDESFIEMHTLIKNINIKTNLQI